MCVVGKGWLFHFNFVMDTLCFFESTVCQDASFFPPYLIKSKILCVLGMKLMDQSFAIKNKNQNKKTNLQKTKL